MSAILERFHRKVRIEYLCNGLWKQDYVRCTIVDLLRRMEEIGATHIKMDLPDPGTGKWRHYMVVKGEKGWSVKVGQVKIK